MAQPSASAGLGSLVMQHNSLLQALQNPQLQQQLQPARQLSLPVASSSGTASAAAAAAIASGDGGPATRLLRLAFGPASAIQASVSTPGVTTSASPTNNSSRVSAAAFGPASWTSTMWEEDMIKSRWAIPTSAAATERKA